MRHVYVLLALVIAVCIANVDGGGGKHNSKSSSSSSSDETGSSSSSSESSKKSASGSHTKKSGSSSSSSKSSKKSASDSHTKKSGSSSSSSKSSKKSASDSHTKKSGSSSSSSKSSKKSASGSHSSSKEQDVPIKNCFVEGSTFPGNQVFKHPTKPCTSCYCCGVTGKEYCTGRPCLFPLPCGINKQEMDSDGCCIQCQQECRDINPKTDCHKTTCGRERIAYKPNDCCPSPGCDLTAYGWPYRVTPKGRFGSCNRCKCKSSGAVTCKSAKCPSEHLKCVDPETVMVDGKCTYQCKQGVTCRRSNVLIKAGEFTRIGPLLCTCSPTHFYPRAFCFKYTEKNRLVKFAQDNNHVASKPPASVYSPQSYKRFFPIHDTLHMEYEGIERFETGG